MKMKIFVICYVFCLSIFFSCADDHIGQTPTDNIAPAAISAVQVKSMPGGADISYDLPKETDISYVKGVYYIKGVEYVVRASIYTNVVKVEGLGSTDPVEVTLYVVDHSENVSEPYIVTIYPATPVVDLIMETMKLRADFGGVNATWKNELESEVGITVLTSNEKGELEEGETYYTNLKDGNYSFRGYNDQLRVFALYLTDKWGNVSDTLKQEITPYFEEQLDKKKHKKVVLPRDNSSVLSSSYTFEKMFDNNISTFWHTSEKDGVLPICFTVDLGVEAKLSRFKLYHRSGTAYLYKHYNPKTFEVWGCTTYKEGMTEDYWEEEWKKDWEQIGDYVTLKPSGDGNVTNEDKEYAEKGFEFTTPLDKDKFRYLRFVVKSTWSGSAYLHIAELTFWGNDNN